MDRALHCNPAAVPSSRHAPFPTSFFPMMATPVDKAFSHADWLFEPKLDGIRAIALVHRDQVSLLSRHGLEITAQYPSLVHTLMRSDVEYVLDGEIVALDQSGRPSFQLLQRRMGLTNDKDVARAESRIPILYFVFDMPYLEGYDLRSVPLERRKELLDCALRSSDVVRLVEYFWNDGVAAFQAAIEHGFEGVVGKHRESTYEEGKRSSRWIKVKAVRTGEFVVGGFRLGQGRREETLGSLLLGYYDRDGHLVYVGHVGSGFDERTLNEVYRHLSAIIADQSPFFPMPRLGGDTRWVRPEVVAEVKFAEFTQDGNLRAPVFLRLRPDLPANSVYRPEREQLIPLVAEGATEAGGQGSDVNLVRVVEQLSLARKNTVLSVGAEEVRVTNLEKEMWPATHDRRALTKRDLLIYLCKLSPHLLRHMRDRPVTLIRYPNGIAGARFFQKRVVKPIPRFVQTLRVFSEQNGSDRDYILCNNLPTLLWLGQLADLELHCTLARVDAGPDADGFTTRFTGSRETIKGSVLNAPDFILFDLDPFIYSGQEAPGADPAFNREGFEIVRRVAGWLKAVLDELHLTSFVKTSGATGLHIYVPVVRHYDYHTVQSLAEHVARFLMQSHPNEVTVDWQVERRRGKVFLDFNQNARGKSLSVPYSPRPLPEATVSMPLSWDEVARVFPTDFTMLTAPDRVARLGDRWASILTSKQDLNALL